MLPKSSLSWIVNESNTFPTTRNFLLAGGLLNRLWTGAKEGVSKRYFAGLHHDFGKPIPISKKGVLKSRFAGLDKFYRLLAS